MRSWLSWRTPTPPVSERWVALCRTEQALSDLAWLAGRVPVHLVAAGRPALAATESGLPIGALVLDLDASPAANQIDRTPWLNVSGAGAARDGPVAGSPTGA
jgi:hypothetical protein